MGTEVEGALVGRATADGVRGPMKARRKAASLGLGLLGLTACGGPSGGSGGQRTLNIYNWTGYISEEVVRRFEKEQGVQVSIDTFDNNETLMAKLQSGASDYDLTVVSAEFIPILKADRLVQKINASALPGYQNLQHRWKIQAWDVGNAYSIPWHWGITSYMVDTKVYGGPLDSLSLLFAPPPALRGRVGMFSSPTEVISLALTYLGQPLCNDKAAALKSVYTLLQAQKPFVKTYDSSGMVDRLASGETAIAQIDNGQAMLARKQRASLRYVFAREGGVAWVDNVVIPVSAAHPDLAKRFISFMMRPENAALEQEAVGNPTGVDAERLLPRSIADAPEYRIPAGYKAAVSPTCSASVVRKYDSLWTRLRG